MTQQYGRVCSLVVGDKNGAALDFSQFHIRFAITNGDVQTPKTANIRVYNVARDVALRAQKEFTQVVLQGGYEGAPGVLFAGQVRQIRVGRENETDTFLDILAADGDVAYLQATMKETLSAGWTPTEMRDRLIKSMEPFGVTAGQLVDLPDTKSARATTLYGATRDFLRQLCQTYGLTWSVENGQLNMRPVTGMLGGTAIVLTSNTGLIGRPQQTIDGIMVKCLIDPRIKPGSQVKIDNASVQEAPISTSTNFRDVRPTLDSDGSYRVWAVAINGDTRGRDWYMDLVCTGVDGTLPLSPGFVQLRGIYGS